MEMQVFQQSSFTMTMYFFHIPPKMTATGNDNILTCVGLPDHLHIWRPTRNADILGLGIHEMSSGSILGFFTNSLDDLEIEPLQSFLLRDLLLETCSSGDPLVLETANALATNECCREEVEGSLGCRSPR